MEQGGDVEVEDVQEFETEDVIDRKHAEENAEAWKEMKDEE